MNNLIAFLAVIAISEGTKGKCNTDGYTCLVGGGCFNGYQDHPRIYVPLPNLGINSSAAGRYQIRAHIYDAYKKQLNLSNFSPPAQDAIAIQLITECKAMDDINAGAIQGAIGKCSSRWASFPGNSYGQHQNTIISLLDSYQNEGGLLS